MRVTVRTNTARRLDLRLRPVSTWVYWLVGVGFIAAGAWAGLTLGRVTGLHCERAADQPGRCILSLSSGVTVSRRAVPAEEILGARTEVRRNLFSASTVVVVRLKDGDVDLPFAGADGVAKDSLVARIGSFVSDNTQTALDMHEDMRLVGWLLGLLVAAGGVICILAVERVRLVLDRDAGTVRLLRKRMMGIKRSEFELSRLSRVEKSEFTFRQTRSWAVTLILDQEDEVALTHTPLFTHASADQVASLITAWMQ